MNVVAMDTHAVVKALTAAGFTDEQAEAVTHAIRDAHDVDLSALATRADLASLATKTDLTMFATKLELASLATKADLTVFATKLELAETKADILKWMIGTIGVQTIVIITAVLALSRLLPL